MNIKTAIFSTAIAGTMMTVCAEEQEVTTSVPEVKSVTMSQAADRRVTVTYTMDNAPAVVTLDIQTNCVVNGETKWASIGGQAICNANGAVWRKVSAEDAGQDGAYSITWRPDLSWPDHKIPAGGARAVVTAWALDNTPDYMVVDLSASAEAGSQNYYPSADFLPGGLLGNPDYRTTSLVMRKIMAKDVTWTMGSVMEGARDKNTEATHKVMLDGNYYIGVFEITQSQWMLVSGTTPSIHNHVDGKGMRPVENVSYNAIRNSTADNNYPNDPSMTSFLGYLKNKTGIYFDLPSEAQWEFAARAGNGDRTWGDGSSVQDTDYDANLDKLGRYQFNGGFVKDGDAYTAPNSGCGPENGTAIVGTYEQNDWGLYDMHGNVWEWCLDWYVADISALGGKVNVDKSTEHRVIRGGSYRTFAGECRSARRYLNAPSSPSLHIGFRVVCTAGLK